MPVNDILGASFCPVHILNKDFFTVNQDNPEVNFSIVNWNVFLVMAMKYERNC